MVNSDKNRLLEIPPCGHEPPDDGLRRIPQTPPMQTKKGTCVCM